MVGDKRHFGLSAGESAAIASRREELGEPATNVRCEVGLALSGGGIRSATFALGIVQAMAEQDTFRRIDILSTVSGGGYVGSFVRSLFIPHELRFPGAVLPLDPPGAPDEPQNMFRRRYNWAMGVLKMPPSVRIQPPILAALDNAPPDPTTQGRPGATARTNPIWWLREHGRYLAPNGSGDYVYALAYIVRAWFALQFVVLISLLTIFLAFKLALAAGFVWLKVHDPVAACMIDYGVNILSWPASVNQAQAACKVVMEGHTLAFPFGFDLVDLPGFKLSPLLAVPALIWLVAIIPLAMAYWESVLVSHWRHHEIRLAAISLLLLVLVGVLWRLPTIAVVHDALGWGSWIGRGMAIGIAAGVPLLIIAAWISAGSGLEAMRSELRRQLTFWMASVMQASAFMLYLGFVDSIALNIVRPGSVATQSDMLARFGFFGTIIPVIIWLTKKIQQWLPALQRLQSAAASANRALPGLLLVLGLGAYSIIAVVCATLAYLIVWDKAVPWSAADFGHAPAFVSGFILFGLSLAAAIVTGLSPNFLNISSLHLFYAGRLTRAYLGASNGRRLQSFNPNGEGGRAGSIREFDPGDMISMDIYHNPRILAPIHLINVNANETEASGSQLIQRDRKGQNLCVGPDGVALGGRRVSWRALDRTRAEALPVGKWMAISGAAASSGMGSATSLGGALLTTFANVRLGYWWYVPLLGGRAKLSSGGATFSFGGPLETQIYLSNEMAEEYSRRNKLRLNLSDGGHYENSGALELIRRRLPIIIVSDAAADPGYDFGDLANLAHLSRVELGAEIRPLNSGEMAGLPPNLRRHFGKTRAFREKQARDAICAILFRIDYFDGTRPSVMLFIKPRVPASAPPDILTYARQHASFPQEPTVDQFFDAAQWENYRKLGNVIGSACLSSAAFDELERLHASL